MRWVYFGKPHLGGTWMVFTSLREALAPRGIELTWLGVGALAPGDAERFARFASCGGVVCEEPASEQARARALHAAVVGGDYEGVFVNVHADAVQTNLARYLPVGIKRILIVHSITPTTYRAARAVRDHVHRTVGVAPRIRDDLIARHGFAAGTTVFIPNAVDLSKFAAARAPGRGDPVLRVLSLGRLEDASKGVFWLPQIVEAARARLRLTIAGDGPDRAALETRCRRFRDRIRLVGRVPHERVPGWFAEHDVFLFPSRFEGLPNALLEAMASGCVPLASRIRGVTDSLVRDGENGCLFPIGDVRAAARHLDELALDRPRLERLSHNAAQLEGATYSLSSMGEAYGRQIEAARAQQGTAAPPESLEAWSMPALLRPHWGSYLPQWLKNRLRRALLR